MKKVLLLALFFSFTALFATQTEAAKYKLNDAKIDALFETATTSEFGMFNAETMDLSGLTTVQAEEKDPLVAILLDIFVGGLGVHRFYLGTKTMTGIGYILTCGGIFGVVPLVDLIVLAVNYDDISPYVDNPKFFMW